MDRPFKSKYITVTQVLLFATGRSWLPFDEFWKNLVTIGKGDNT